MSDAVRVGLAGCGRLAEMGYVPAAEALSELSIAAVCDPDPERRSIVGASTGAAGFASLGEMLENGGLDAVVIASPPSEHAAQAEATCAARMTTLIEKPPAHDLAGTIRIAALDPAPWIGFNRRFSLGRGIAGTLPTGGSLELEIRYRRRSWAPVEVADPVLLDLAPHLIDLALHAGLGEPRSVVATSERPERLRLRMEGANGTAEIGCACDLPHRERATVRSADDGLVVRRRLGGPIRGLVERVWPGPHPLAASLAAQLAELARAVRGEVPALASAAEGVAVMRVVVAAAESLSRGGEPIELAEHVAGTT